MAQWRFEKFLELCASAGVNISNTFKMRLINGASPASNIIKAITSITGAASPITITVASTTGWSNGDKVVVWGVTGNTCANQTAVIANITGTTFDIQTVPGPGESQLAMTGNAAGTVTNAFVMNLSLASASTDLPAALGTDATLVSPTATKGKFTTGTNPSISNVPASSSVKAAVFYQSTGTDRLAFWADGLIQIRVVTAAALSATTLNVEPLYATIPSGTVIPLSNGVVATTTAQANAGATAISVSALSGAVPVGHTGDATILNANLPATMGSPGNQTFNYVVDATNGIFPI